MPARLPTIAAALVIACSSETTPTQPTASPRPGHLSFSTQPTLATADQSISPVVRVTIQDSSGLPMSGAGNSVTLALSANPGNAALSGTLTVSASGGIATFSDLRLDQAGKGYKLTATAAGFTDAVSEPFNVAIHFVAVSTGEWSACGITPAGRAYCWGDNVYGELGIGTTGSNTSPVAVTGGLPFKAISVGGVYACGLTMAGSAYCWGANGYGQLGNGTTTGPQPCGPNSSPTYCSLTPVAVAGGLTFSALSTGGVQTCGITPAGAAYCWGYNSSGSLGNGTTTVSSTPVAVAGGLTFAMVSAGSGQYPFTCGVTTAGAGYCWGDHSTGELGSGPLMFPWPCILACSTTPVAVAGGLTFTTISAGLGSGHPCGVTTSNAAYCWGGGVPSPVALPGGLAFSAVRVGDAFACGLTTIGTAYCWGDTGDGQLGTGTLQATSATPVAVTGGFSFTALSVGYFSTCALTATGTAYCWGLSDHGQLGAGITGASSIPVPVAP